MKSVGDINRLEILRKILTAYREAFNLNRMEIKEVTPESAKTGDENNEEG